MHFFSELRQLLWHFLWWLIMFLLVSAAFFAIGFNETVFEGYHFFVPVITTDSVAAAFFNQMVADLVPAGVTLVVTNPLSPFLIQMQIAFFLGFLATAPLFLYRLLRYLSPALYPRERHTILLLIIPTTLLFSCGAAFSYYFIIPPTFSFLYTYASTLNALPYFTAGEFIGFALSMLVATGFMFLLPIAMALLSRLGIIGRSVWRRQWRYATLTFLIVTAIITPDGSGISMLMLTLPLLGLYVVGIAVSGKEQGSIINNQALTLRGDNT